MLIANVAVALVFVLFWIRLSNQHRLNEEILVAKIEEGTQRLLQGDTQRQDLERFAGNIAARIRFSFGHFREVEHVLFSGSVFLLLANAWAWGSFAKNESAHVN